MTKQQDDDKIIITADNGEERVCEILFTYHCPENNKDYVILVPEESSDDEDEGIYFAFSYIETADGSGELYNIEDQAEFDLLEDVINQYYEDLYNEEDLESENE